jgi:4-hydroxy-4-methyl-2-oxoglutarate aldolase
MESFMAKYPEIDSGVRSAIMSDCLDQLGLPSWIMSTQIRPLDTNMKAVGFARTITFSESEDYNAAIPYGEPIEFLGSLNPFDLVVIPTSNPHQSAFWGELFLAAAKGRGAVEVVCDGALRNTEQVCAQHFAAFGNGTSPSDYKGYMGLLQV